MIRATFVTSLALLLLAAPAFAHGEHAAEAVEQTVDERVRLDGKSTMEIDMFLPANATIQFEVDAGKDKVYVDLHSHGSVHVVNHFQENSTSAASSSFTADEDGTYSLYVINRGEDRITVDLFVQGTFAVTGTSGFDVEEESPLSPLTVVLALGLVLAWTTRGRQRPPRPAP